jgi:hypothetical protein
MVEDRVQRALREGASRSLRACSENELVPRHVQVWQRHKWKVLGLLLFLLIDLVLLGGLGSTFGMKF